MARFTQALQTGVRIMGGADIPVYNLTYMSNDSKHRAGDYETIVIPYIELGRSPSCAVNFGDEFGTVSRRHAAIERQNKEYIIKHIGTNTTLVNGRPVKDQWFLTNGDILQLSMEGPRMRFNISATGTGKMASTQKIKLLAQQLVRPYRTALIGLAAVLVVLAVVGGRLLFKQGETITQQGGTIAQQGETIKLQKKQLDSLGAIATKNAADDARRDARYRASLRNISQSGISPSDASGSNLPPPSSNQPTNTPVKPPMISDGVGMPDGIKEEIYFIRVKDFKVTLPNGEEKQVDVAWTGTGFLLADGKFVTARHVIQAWRFITENESEMGKRMVLCNLVEQGGAKITVTFEAISSKAQFEFTNEQFTLNDNGDKTVEIKGGEGAKLRIAEPNDKDWAYCTSVNGKSAVASDAALSKELKAGEEVHVLGYSYGGDLQQRNLKPLYSKSIVAQDNLTNGLINLTNRNFGSGNSGGPVFVKRGDQFIAIGIVSAGIGAEIGIVVPLSAMR